jgi:hypothetical protein
VSETSAVHVAAPSGYILHGCTASGHDIVPLVKVVILDQSTNMFKVLYCPVGHPSCELWVPKSVVCLKYPIVVNFSEDAGLMTFRYRMVSLTSTRGLTFDFKMDGAY